MDRDQIRRRLAEIREELSDLQQLRNELAELEMIVAGMETQTFRSRAHQAMHTVCLVNGLDYDRTWKERVLSGPERRARHATWVLLRELGMSFASIGDQTGGWDHTTVMSAVKNASPEVVEEAMKMKEMFDAQPASAPTGL